MLPSHHRQIHRSGKTDPVARRPIVPMLRAVGKIASAAMAGQCAVLIAGWINSATIARLDKMVRRPSRHGLTTVPGVKVRQHPCSRIAAKDRSLGIAPASVVHASARKDADPEGTHVLR